MSGCRTTNLETEFSEQLLDIGNDKTTVELSILAALHSL